MTWRKAVVLEGGPADGRSFDYWTPLPTILVTATRNGRIEWHDYRRIGQTATYRYVPPSG